MPVVCTQTVSSSFMLGQFIEFLFNEGSGQEVFNQLGDMTPFLPNLLSTGEQLAAGLNGDGWNAGGSVTATDFAGTDPNGNNSATRVQLTSNGAFMYYQPPLAAGDYTFSVYMKSNTGVSQTCRAGAIASPLSITATTSWQRFHNTFNLAAPDSPAIASVWEDAANNPVDVLVYGVQLEAGTSLSAYTPPTFDMQLGAQPTADSRDPAWIAEGQNLNGNKYDFGITDIPVPCSTISVYAAVKQTAADLASGLEPIIAEQYGSVKMILSGALQSFGTISGTQVPSFMFHVQHADAYAVILNDGNWHVLCGVYDGVKVRLYMDGVEVASTTVPVTSVNINRIYVGRLTSQDAGNTYFPGDIAYASVCSTAHTKAQVINNSATIAGLLVPRGITVNVIDKWIAFEGDSLTDPTGAPPPSGRVFSNGWVYMLLHDLSPIVQARNFAITGSSLVPGPASIANASRYQPIDDTYDASRSANILTVFIGANDLNSGVVDTTFVADLKAYCLQRKTVGWTIIVCTLLPQTHTGVNALRNSINALIVADPDFGNGNACDALARLDLQPNIGPDAAASDTSLYSDGEHLTALGNSFLWPVVEAVLTPLL